MVRHRAKNVAISQYEKLFWQTKTSCENILSILSFRGGLLQYTFALSTLLVHLRNKRPLENQSIIKGLECPEQGHKYWIELV